ncbi:MAG: hypothetical protein MZW92_52610 [Comamonadaceae bacterium]|nr:hypothetical protein [Comamonadaceae bacterium]
MMEAAVQPLSVVRELPSDLPPYSPGQRFSANIQSVLPDGTFRAIVAGRTVTLSLPQSAMAGDALELGGDRPHAQDDHCRPSRSLDGEPTGNLPPALR